MNKLDIKVIKRLIKLRNELDAISQISWSFSLLNKQNPIATLTDKEAKELIEAYEELIQDLRALMDKWATKEKREIENREPKES